MIGTSEKNLVPNRPFARSCIGRMQGRMHRGAGGLQPPEANNYTQNTVAKTLIYH